MQVWKKTWKPESLEFKIIWNIKLIVKKYKIKLRKRGKLD